MAFIDSLRPMRCGANLAPWVRRTAILTRGNLLVQDLQVNADVDVTRFRCLCRAMPSRGLRQQILVGLVLLANIDHVRVIE